MKDIKLKVRHVHPEVGNITCDPIEELDGASGFVYRCSACDEEIVVTLEEEASP